MKQKCIEKKIEILNEEIFDLAKEISIKYKLLPNDALIAATCKYYGISKIATLACLYLFWLRTFEKFPQCN